MLSAKLIRRGHQLISMRINLIFQKKIDSRATGLPGLSWIRFLGRGSRQCSRVFIVYHSSSFFPKLYALLANHTGGSWCPTSSAQLLHVDPSRATIGAAHHAGYIMLVLVIHCEPPGVLGGIFSIIAPDKPSAEKWTKKTYHTGSEFTLPDCPLFVFRRAQTYLANFEAKAAMCFASAWARGVVLPGMICSPRQYSPALGLQRPMIGGELRRSSVRLLPRLIPLRTRIDAWDRKPTRRRDNKLPIPRTTQQPKATLRGKREAHALACRGPCRRRMTALSVSVCSILCSNSSPCASMAASASSFSHSTWLSSAYFDTPSAFFMQLAVLVCVRAGGLECLCLKG